MRITRLLFSVLFSSATCIGLATFAYAQEKDPSAIWAKTTFSFEVLNQAVLNPTECSYDEKSYLGCVEAMNVMLGQLKPRRTLSSEDQKPLPGFENEMSVNGFVILREIAAYKAPEKLTPAAQLRKNREDQAERDATWLAHRAKNTAFDKLLATTRNLFAAKDEKRLAGEAINAYLATALDPHTYYMPKAQWDEARNDTSESFVGIGALLSKHPSGTMIRQAYQGSPARAAGLDRGDLIVEVDGQPTADVELANVVKMIRGEQGTVVKLLIRRGDEKKMVEITRAPVSFPKVSGSELKTLSAARLGYIAVTDFMGGNSCANFMAMLKQFSNLQGVIIDLRGNGGGDVGINNCMLGPFLSAGDLIMTARNPQSNQIFREYRAETSPMRHTLPTVVLIDQGSASASEIFAGTLQDYKKAILVGERSYGKGTMQSIRADSKFGETLAAVTSARFHLPSGRSNQKVGLKPDFEAHVSPDPTQDELLSFREADLYRFPVTEGPAVATPVNPTAEKARPCVASTGQARAAYATYGDYQLQVAVDVLNCVAK